MEITEAVHTQIVFPGLIVSFVLVFAVLVFVFGFKSVEDFPFDKLATTNDNRKPAGKKRKAKDKKGQPGQITSVVENKQKNVDNEKYVANTTKSKAVEKTTAKEPPKTNIRQDEKQSVIKADHNTPLKETKTNRAVEKHTKTQIKEKSNKNSTVTKKTQNKGKENVNIQNKKNQDHSTNKSKLDDKQNDDDGGEWEQAFSRKDKKTKKSPLIEEEPVEKLIKSDGKKKKTGNQNEPVNIPAESESQVAPPTPALVPTPAPTPAPTPTPSPAPQQQVDQEPTKVVAAEATKVVASKKNKEQKKENPKTLKEDTNKKIVEQSSEPKEKHSPKEHSESKKFIENEKENTAEVISSEIKPPKGTHVKDLTDHTTPVFDELGDSWQEAKAAKKQSKKKVRKAE